MHTDVLAAEIARRQHGLISLEQALEVGITEDQVRRRLRTREWSRPRRAVFAIAAAAKTWEQTVLAAVMAAGPGAVASHLTAAALHEFPDALREGVEVSVPPGRNPKLRGLRVHRPGGLPEHDVRVVAGIPVTSYARTLVDCSGWMSLGQVARALDAGLVRRDVTLWSVERSLAALRAAPGRHPSKLRVLLDERGSGIGGAESRPEIRVLRVLRSGGLPEPVQQHWARVGGERFRLDFAYPDQKVAIEYDGWDWHSTRGAFDRDRRRDRLLQLAGWTVLRITSRTTDGELLETLRAFVH